jgi:glycosyltransferase involved in cell wall biosynthesis
MRKNIAVLFPAFYRGGAEAVAVWILEALKQQYDLSLFTFSEIDFDKINQQYGTQLSSSEIELITPYQSLKINRMVVNRFSLFTFRQYLLESYYKKIANRYDFAISANNEMDLGKPGMQYIHFPMFGRGNEISRKMMGYPVNIYNRTYHKLCEIASGYSDERMKKNTTLANSRWTANLIRDLYQIEPIIVYPPVVMKDSSPSDWENREEGFIYSTRIVSEKRVLEAIEIIGDLRKQGFNLHLHILSPGSDPAYREKVIDVQHQNPDWVFIEENLDRGTLSQMISSHKYGIHMNSNEPFGISIAECVKAGCIVFVPSGGGQEEAVGCIPELIIHHPSEAVSTISSVLSDPQKQKSILIKLSESRGSFSTDTFCSSIRGIVERTLENQ